MEELKALAAIGGSFGGAIAFAWLIKKFLLDFVTMQVAQNKELTQDQKERNAKLALERDTAVAQVGEMRLELALEREDHASTLAKIRSDHAEMIASLRLQMANIVAALHIARAKIRTANDTLARAGLSEVSDVVVDVVNMRSLPGGPDDR